MKTPVRDKILPFLIGFLVFSISAISQNTSTTTFDQYIANWAHFHDNGNYDRAIQQAQQAFSFAEKIKETDLAAIALNREGRSLVKVKKRVSKSRKEAEEKFNRSLLYLANSDDTDLRIDNLENLKFLAEMDKNQQKVDLYQKQIEEIKTLLFTSATNEELADQVDSFVVHQQVLSQKIQTLSDAQLQSELLIALQKNQVDSLSFARAKDSLLLAEQVATLDLQQSQIKLQKSQRNLLLALAAIVAFLGIGALLRYWETKKYNSVLESKNQIIEKEIKKSDALLLNILPAIVADELKLNGVAKAKKYDLATVFFSDFKNFSGIARSLSPEELVYELDLHFKAFDGIIDNYNLEKIKTIGDAYMCVGGVPKEDSSHPSNVIRAALEIQSYLHDLQVKRNGIGKPPFEARIGIHTGPLVAGVVGSKKFAYDVWGDTVNVAAGLEKNGAVSKVNISAATYELIKADFECEHRGWIAVKNLGEVEMYFVKEAL